MMGAPTAGERTRTTPGDDPPQRNTVHPHTIADRLGNLGLARYNGFALWALFIVVFGVLVPQTFFTPLTVTSILSAQSISAILTLAVLFPLAAGVFDLSIAQNLGTSALIAGYLMTKGPQLSPTVTILIVLVFGGVVGVVNGFLVAVVGINSFIATLGTSSLLLAIAGHLAKGLYFGPFPESFVELTSPAPGGIPIIAFYLLIIALIVWYVLEHTPFGRRVYATGANEEAARLAGVQTKRYVMTSFVICGVGASVAGILVASSTNAVNQTLGPQYLLPAFAAAFLGTTQIKLGRFNVWGAMLAIFLLGTGVVGLQLVAGSQTYYTDYFNGAALILAVGGAVLLEKKRGWRQKRRQLKERKDGAQGIGSA